MAGLPFPSPSCLATGKPPQRARHHLERSQKKRDNKSVRIGTDKKTCRWKRAPAGMPAQPDLPLSLPGQTALAERLNLKVTHAARERERRKKNTPKKREVRQCHFAIATNQGTRPVKVSGQGHRQNGRKRYRERENITPTPENSAPNRESLRTAVDLLLQSSRVTLFLDHHLSVSSQPSVKIRHVRPAGSECCVFTLRTKVGGLRIAPTAFKCAQCPNGAHSVIFFFSRGSFTMSARVFKRRIIIP